MVGEETPGGEAVVDAQSIAKGYLEDLQTKWLREKDRDRKRVLDERARKLQKMMDEYWGPGAKKNPPADLEERLRRIAEGEET